MAQKEQTHKPVSATHIEMNEIVLPNDANILGNILGGKVMHLIDIACAVAAHRHCRRPVVTAAMDSMDFRHRKPWPSAFKRTPEFKRFFKPHHIIFSYPF